MVNAEGIVIGVPTLKIIGADRMGFAAPFAGLSMADFGPVEEKKGDPDEAARLSEMALRFMLGDALTLGNDPIALELAIFLQREAISLDPNNPQYSGDLAGMYERLGNFPVALAYAQSSIKTDPTNITTREMVASYHDNLGQGPEALAVRLAGLPFLEKSPDNELRTRLMENLASGMADSGKTAEAVYIISWLKALERKELGSDARLVLQKAADVLPKETVTAIMNKADGHSVANLAAVAKTAPAPGIKKPEMPVAAAEDSVRQPSSDALKIFSKPEFKAGVTVQLMDSPANVTYDPATATLEWNRIPFSSTASVEVLFLLTLADGSEELMVHAINRE